MLASGSHLVRTPYLCHHHLGSVRAVRAGLQKQAFMEHLVYSDQEGEKKATKWVFETVDYVNTRALSFPACDLQSI